MHYCADELSSLQIYQTKGIKDFCCDDTEDHDVLISGNFCCETEILKLATDEYQRNSELPVSRISSVSIDITGMALINQLIPESDPNTLLSTLKFPTTGHYLEDLSILTYICIYRI